MDTFKRRIQSLQAQLILWAILPVSLVIIVLAFTGVYSHQQAMLDFVVERNTVVADLIAAGIQDDLYANRVHPDGSGIVLSAATHSDEIYVVNSARQILAHTNPALIGEEVASDIVLPQNGLATAVSVEMTQGAIRYLVTLTTVESTDWFVVIQEPVDDLIGPILRFSSLGPTVALLAVGLSLIILTFAWRTIVSPLRQLAQAAEQVNWGEHQVLQNSTHGVTEIQELHGVLVSMVKRLESYENSIRDYAEEMTVVQESERSRLARELHDGPVQALIAQGHRLEMTQQALEHNNLTLAQVDVRDIRKSQTGIIQDLRRTMSALRPPYLEDLGLEPALRMLVKSVLPGGVRIDCEITAPQQRYCEHVELAVYRIAQESVNNALRHAYSTHIRIGLVSQPDRVALTITDDGMGFIPAEYFDAYTKAGHFGLVGMRERVRQLHGHFQVSSSPGEGTTVYVSLPLACSDCDKKGLPVALNEQNVV